MEILRFDPTHLRGITPREPDPPGLNLPCAAIRAGFFAQHGPAYTLTAHGRVIACGGVALLRDRVGEAWVITTAEVDRYPFLFHKTVKRGLAIIMEEFGLRRVQAHVNREWPEARQWIERLGFSEEGLMAAIGAVGEQIAYIRYGKVEKKYE